MIWPAIDEQLFYFIHHELANGFLDAVLPYWREKTTWIPAYLLAIGWLIYRYGWSGVQILILVAVGITISDQLTSSVIKPLVGRARPCYNPAFDSILRELVGCGGHDGFPSSHAANHFTLAMILSLTWLKNRKTWQWLLFLWAASISLAQVYVGKHYPIDILVGGLLGITIGNLLVRLVSSRWSLELIERKPRSAN